MRVKLTLNIFMVFLVSLLLDGCATTGCIKDNCSSGRGTYLYKDGDKYEGQWKNGKRNGQGTYTWKDGKYYKGEFKNGDSHGIGVEVHPNGKKLEGEWRYNKYLGELIRSDELNKLFSGKTVIFADNSMGDEYHAPNGTCYYNAKKDAFENFSGGVIDGKWFVRNNQICYKYPIDDEKKTHCHEQFRKDNDIYNNNGKKLSFISGDSQHLKKKYLGELIRTEELKTLFSGKTVYKEDGEKEYHAPNGTCYYDAKKGSLGKNFSGGVVDGKWFVRNNQICYKYPVSKKTHCHRQFRKDHNIYTVYGKKLRFISGDNERLASAFKIKSASFLEGRALIEINGKYGYINKSGGWVVKPKFDDANPYVGGLAKVKMNGKYGYINKNGAWVIKPKFDWAVDFDNQERITAVKMNGKYGYINENGGWAVKPKFDEANYYYGGLAKVKMNDKYGYINKTGKIISFVCDHVYVGKVFKGEFNLFIRYYEVMGFSNRTGKATITSPRDRSYYKEISCKEIPE